MAKQNLRQSYIDAVTNRAKAQTLNTMYPNYQIDPTTGGMLDFYKGTPIRGQYPQDVTDAQIARLKRIQTADPRITWKDVYGHEKESGSEDDRNTDPMGRPYGI